MKIKVGERIKFDQLTGTIKYIGNIRDKDGIWVGIMLDTDDGKNDGSINGVRYFDCGGKNCGLFVREEKIYSDFKNLDEHNNTVPDTNNYKAKCEKLKILKKAQENVYENKINEISKHYKNMLKLKENEFNKLQDLYKKELGKNIKLNTKIKEIKERMNKIKININKHCIDYHNHNKEIQKIISANNNTTIKSTNNNFVDNCKDVEVRNIVENIFLKLINNEDVDDLYNKFNEIMKSNGIY